MVKFVFVFIFSFCVFITSLIILTRKEEANEKRLKESSTSTKGHLTKVERTGKSISKGEMTFTYAAIYLYCVNNSNYRIKVLYEVRSDVLDAFPEEVDVYYDVDKPDHSIVKIDQNKFVVKESVRSLVPSIGIALIVGSILFHFFVFPLV